CSSDLAVAMVSATENRTSHITPVPVIVIRTWLLSILVMVTTSPVRSTLSTITGHIGTMAPDWNDQVPTNVSVFEPLLLDPQPATASASAAASKRKLWERSARMRCPSARTLPQLAAGGVSAAVAKMNGAFQLIAISFTSYWLASSTQSKSEALMEPTGTPLAVLFAPPATSPGHGSATGSPLEGPWCGATGGLYPSMVTCERS